MVFQKIGFCKISEVKLTLTGTLLGWVTLPKVYYSWVNQHPTLVGTFTFFVSESTS
jgi:hypothetical protein